MGKTYQFAPFQIGVAFAGGLTARLRQGWQPARGKDPLGGIQRIQQHGPQGDAQFSARGYLDDWYDKL